MIGGKNQTGSYYAQVYMDWSTPGLSGVVGSDGSSVKFVPVWHSPDSSVVYMTGSYLTFRRQQGTPSSAPARNYAVTITNLHTTYLPTDVARIRVSAVDFNTDKDSYFLPYTAPQKIFQTALWRCVDPYTKDVYIPFHNPGTLISADGESMWFDLHMQSLPVNKTLEIQVGIVEHGSTWVVSDQGFLFKILEG